MQQGLLRIKGHNSPKAELPPVWAIMDHYRTIEGSPPQPIDFVKNLALIKLEEPPNYRPSTRNTL